MLAERFPPEEDQLLPTAFGNTIKAFETYPDVMYGFDAIEGWTRLLAVIPKDYRELIETTKAETDFWVNLWFISLLILCECVGATFYTGELKIVMFSFGALGSA